MFRFSMLGWVGVAFLVVAVTHGHNSLGQGTTTETILNPRACVIDETQKDTCPTKNNVACPSGSCTRLWGIPGCLHDGSYVLLEVTNISGGAQVDAAKPAGPNDNGKSPSSTGRTVCYTQKRCWCKRQDNGSWHCVPSENVEEFVIRPWTASNVACAIVE